VIRAAPVRDPEKDHALFLRYVAGEELAPLADEAGLTRQGLRDRWRIRGWQLPSRRKWLLASEAKAIRAMAENGKPICEMVAATGRQREVINAFLRREGLTTTHATPSLRKTEHWRHLLGRLLDGETWRAILGPEADSRDRKRELHGLQRYCAHVGIPLPKAAKAAIGSPP